MAPYEAGYRLSNPYAATAYGFTPGEVVKAFRRRAGLTQEQFAPMVGYAVTTVASIEQGRRFPPVAFVDRAEELLDAFGAIRGAAKHLARNRLDGVPRSTGLRRRAGRRSRSTCSKAR